MHWASLSAPQCLWLSVVVSSTGMSIKYNDRITEKKRRCLTCHILYIYKGMRLVLYFFLPSLSSRK